jgi:photosystem II stability/assembly factor-like uncharacterized protein
MKKIGLVFSLVLFLTVSFQINSQTFWQETNGPSGGLVQCLALDKLGNLYSGFDTGWWISHKGNCFYKLQSGDSEWHSIRSIEYNKDVESIIIDTSGFIYLWLGGSGVVRSTNNGISWEKIWSGINSFYSGYLGSCKNDILILANYDGVFVSSNHGSQWNLSSINSICTYCYVDNSDNIFVSVYNQGIYKSTDYGASWIYSGQGINGDVKNIIHFNNNLYFAVTESGVFESTNYGDHWTQLNSGLIAPSSICKGSENQLFVGTEMDGVYSSLDSGKTWAPQNQGLDRLNITALITILSGDIVAGVYGDGLFKYSVNQNEWIEFNSGIKSINITSFIKFQDYLFVGSERGTIFKSSDDGNNWFKTKSPTLYTPILSFGDAKSGSMFFSTWQYRDYVLKNSSTISERLITADNNINNYTDIIDNSGVDRIYKSTDEGNIWKEVSQVYVLSFINYFDPLSNSEYLFAAAGRKGVYSSTDDGETWFPVNNGLQNEYIEDIKASSNGYLYASSSNKIFRSDDFGKSWITVYANYSAVYHIVIDVTKNNFLFAGLDWGSVILSTDNGNSWEDRGYNLPVDRVNEITSDTLGNLFIGNWWGEIYESADFGQNWVNISSGSVGGLTKNLYCDSNGFIFLGQYGSNVLKSSKRTYAPAPPTLIYPLHSINQPLEMEFLWTANLVVDSFKIQISYNNSFDTSSIFLEKTLQETSLLVSGLEESTTYFWRVLGINKFGEGFWSNVISFKTKKIVGVDDNDNKDINFELTQNYPNPFNPSTSIHYAISSTQFVTLKVYDLLGREVATLVNEEKAAGSYEIDFNVGRDSSPALASGIYFYKIQAGDFVETKKMILLK